MMSLCLLRVLQKSCTLIKLFPTISNTILISNMSTKWQLKLVSLQSNNTLYIITRQRASYYQDKGIKKALRKAPAIVALSILLMTFFSPAYNFLKTYRALSREEFIDYRNKHNAVIYERIKNGSYLHFPFLTKNIATNQDDETQIVYARSDLPPARTSIY